jgi:hypothetical protein
VTHDHSSLNHTTSSCQLPRDRYTCAVQISFLLVSFFFPLRNHTRSLTGIRCLENLLYFNSTRTAQSPCVDDGHSIRANRDAAGFRIQMSRRQRGQEACLTSQQSMQGTWKTCRHPGNRLAGSPTRKSWRHTEQPSASPAASTAVSSLISISGSCLSASACRPWGRPSRTGRWSRRTTS